MKPDLKPRHFLATAIACASAFVILGLFDDRLAYVHWAEAALFQAGKSLLGIFFGGIAWLAGKRAHPTGRPVRLGVWVMMFFELWAFTAAVVYLP